ncbi:hypothetical protein A2W24_01235 [Microgenomates group bacterium RBG_16_45_19]|nr:MAG: hypothetical protein A2W24_01235 [Microgenomates group bacterium RBG_16_45_19]
MKTVGELLQNARLQQNLSLAEISRQTRIAQHYLAAIEANDFKALPAATFTKGFLRNYAVSLKLDPQTVLAIFRRDYDQDERGRIIPRALTEPVRAPRHLITPTRISLVISGFLGLLVVGFFARQIIIFTQAPPLTILTPVDNTTSASPVLVKGETSPEASVAVNHEPAVVAPDGTFEKAIDLSPGEHTLVVVASSRSGNQRTLQRVVIILPP